MSNAASSLYDELQRNIISEDTLCTLEVEAVTPILIGGYDTRCSHGDLGSEILRASSIKGLWRWWIRALLAAALAKNHGVYVGSIEELDKTLVSVVLGSQSAISRYQLVVEPLGKNAVKSVCLEQYKSVPRIALLQSRYQSRERASKPNQRCAMDEVIGCHSAFRIFITRTNVTSGEDSKSADALAIWSLIIALILDGVGKITSRGFGKLKINRIKGSSTVKDEASEIEDILGKLYNASSAIDVEHSLKQLVKRAVEKASDFISIEIGRSKNLLDELSKKAYTKPLIETALPDNLLIVKVVNREFTEINDVLEAINQASMKIYWKTYTIMKSLGGTFDRALKRARDISGADENTWILGLPRSQEPSIIPNGNKRREVQQKLEEAINKCRKRKDFDERKLHKLYERVIVRKRGRGKAKVCVPTGYYYLGYEYEEDIKLRRKSPIRFTVIPAKDKFYVVLFAFKTYEWNMIMNGLVHIGAYYEYARSQGRSGPVNVKEFKVTPISVNVDIVFRDAINKIMDLIENYLPYRTRRR